jgi:hypothetical protein
MKRMLLAVTLVSILSFSCTGVDNTYDPNAAMLTDTTRYTTIQWLDSVVNFGTVNMGEQVTVAFRFRNTGNQPLFLTNVKAGCGCTVPDYTTNAITPRGEGVVTGAFNTNKVQPGEARKSIFVTTNTRNNTNHTLIFTGVIKEAVKK